MVNNKIISVGIVFGLLLLIIIGLILATVQNKYMIEGFEQPGDYPISVTKPLLYDSYNISNNPGLSNNGAQENYINKPVFPARSLKNNNIRYWNNPTNGQCSPSDFCGNLYIDTHINLPYKVTSPTWDDKTRVNFYVSD